MNEPVVILIHGWNVASPLDGIHKYRPYLEERGCLVEMFSYGYWPLPRQLIKRNPKFAKYVAERTRYWASKGREVYIVAHSNGCVITRLATELYGAKITKVLALHPALRTDLHPCKSADKVLVVHNQGDKAVALGGILGKVSKWLIPDSWQFRPWGKMGQDGCTVPYTNVENIDTGKDFDIIASGHSDEQSAVKGSYFIPLLTERLLMA